MSGKEEGAEPKPCPFSFLVTAGNYSKPLNLNRIHVVGHSMRGAVGLLLTRDIESIIESFVYLEVNLVSGFMAVSARLPIISTGEFWAEAIKTRC